MTSPVTALKKGHSGIISYFTDDQIAGKLMTMGILPGSNLQLIRIAPFRGGYYLKVDGICIAVREKEARSIVVEH